VRETQEVTWHRLSHRSFDRDEVYDFWSELPEDYFQRYSPDEIQWQTAAILEARRNGVDSLVRVRARTHRGGSEVFIYARDRDYLFANATAAMDRLGLSVLDARIITTGSGCALDTFTVLEESAKTVVASSRVPEIEQAVNAALDRTASPPNPPRRLMERRLRQFDVPTELNFYTDTVNHRSIVEVRTGDRPGLLAHLALAMARCGARLQTAKVATLGERAEDIFFLTDAQGEPLDHEMVQCLDHEIHHQLVD
jgi:[protein-PII] uridylyltransferase